MPSCQKSRRKYKNKANAEPHPYQTPRRIKSTARARGALRAMYVIQNPECTTNLSLFTNNAKHKGPHWWKLPRYSKYASCILSHPLDGWHIELKWGKCARAKTDSDDLKGRFGTISSGLRTYIFKVVVCTMHRKLGLLTHPRNVTLRRGAKGRSSIKHDARRQQKSHERLRREAQSRCIDVLQYPKSQTARDLSTLSPNKYIINRSCTG
jgi:hypothetical protein